MPSLSSKYGLSYEYLVSEPITILFSDRVWNCSCWVVKATPSWTLVDAGAFLILWVKSINGYLCKTQYEYDIEGAHRNTFLVVKDTEALVPAFRSTRFNALGLVQKMRRDGKLFVEEEGLEVWKSRYSSTSIISHQLTPENGSSSWQVTQDPGPKGRFFYCLVFKSYPDIPYCQKLHSSCPQFWWIPRWANMCSGCCAPRPSIPSWGKKPLPCNLRHIPPKSCCWWSLQNWPGRCRLACALDRRSTFLINILLD